MLDVVKSVSIENLANQRAAVIERIQQAYRSARGARPSGGRPSGLS